MIRTVSFYCDYQEVAHSSWPELMHEFAANGAERLVLSDTLLRKCLEDSEYIVTLQRIAEGELLHFDSAHAPFGPEDDLNSAGDRAAMLKRQKKVLQIAADLGVDNVTFHFGNVPTEYGLEEQQRNSWRALEELLPVAEQHHLVLALENIWFASCTPERLLETLERFHSPNLGICFDSGHANLMRRPEQPEESCVPWYWERFGEVPWSDSILEQLLPHIVTCHLHDNNGMRDQHLLPGMGNINWPAMISCLKKAPRLRTVQSESTVLHQKESIAKLCRIFSRLWRDGKISP